LGARSGAIPSFAISRVSSAPGPNLYFDVSEHGLIEELQGAHTKQNAGDSMTAAPSPTSSSRATASASPPPPLLRAISCFQRTTSDPCVGVDLDVSECAAALTEARIGLRKF